MLNISIYHLGRLATILLTVVLSITVHAQTGVIYQKDKVLIQGITIPAEQNNKYGIYKDTLEIAGDTLAKKVIKDGDGVNRGKYTIFTSEKHISYKPGFHAKRGSYVRGVIAKPITYIVTNTNDDGLGSLRYALSHASAHMGYDTIVFKIPGAGPYIISPKTALPDITEAVYIDGYSQSGEIVVKNVASLPYSLRASGEDIVIKKITVEGFETGIQLDSVFNCLVSNCTFVNNTDYGIRLEKGEKNTFTQNTIIGSTLESISLASDGNQGANASKISPSIVSVKFEADKCSVEVKAQTNDKIFELYLSDSKYVDAKEYLGNNFTQLSNGNWLIVLSRTESQGKEFVVSSTDNVGNTSEFGIPGSVCMTVVNNKDNGVGSLRNAIECANAFNDRSEIFFKIPDNSKTINLKTALPQVIWASVINSNKQTGVSIVATSTTSKSDAIRFGSISNVIPDEESSIYGVTVSGFANGISVSQHGKLSISNVTATLNAKNGVFVEKTAYDVQLKQVTATDNIGSGFLIQTETASVLIDSCVAIKNQQQGVSILANVATTVAHSTILNNEANGIYVLNNNTRIKQNIIGSNKANGIALFGKAIVDSNYIGVNEQNIVIGNELSGINGQATGCYIAHNRIGNNKQHGIDSCPASIIVGNFIGGEATKSFPNMAWGVHSSEYKTLLNNYIANNGLGGIVCEKGTLIRGTLFAGSQTTAISNLYAPAPTVPQIQTFSFSPGKLYVTGVAAPGDTVELFSTDDTVSDHALARAAIAVAKADSSWGAAILKGDAWDGKNQTFLTATATNAKSFTSRLAKPYRVPKARYGGYIVVNTKNSTFGSLRAVIDSCNKHVGLDTIYFDIAGGGVHTIKLMSKLAQFSEVCVVDGTSQPSGSIDIENTGNFNEPIFTISSLENIVISSVGFTKMATAIVVNGNAKNTIIKDCRFVPQNAMKVVSVLSAEATQIVHNNFTGDTAGKRGFAVYIDSTAKTVVADNTIVGMSDAVYGKNVSALTVFNNTIGICNNAVVLDKGTDSATIIGNYIGVNSAGTVFANAGNGIDIRGVSYLQVESNTIANNKGIGINLADGKYNRYSKNAVFSNKLNIVNNVTTGANMKMRTPYLQKTASSASSVTLKITAVDSSDVIEVFVAGNNPLADAKKYLAKAEKTGYLTWEVTVSGSFSATDRFVATATDKRGNTSEIGYEYDLCLSVVNTEDLGLGSLRKAMECANDYADANRITINLSSATAISPKTSLPNIWTPIFIEKTGAYAHIDGSEIPNYNGFNFVRLQDTAFNTALSGLNGVEVSNCNSAVTINNHSSVLIVASQFKNNKKYGVLVDSSFKSVSIQNNKIDSTKINAVEIKTIGNAKVFVFDNVITNVDSVAIHWNYNQKRSIVSNNIITKASIGILLPKQSYLSKCSINRISVVNSGVSIESALCDTLMGNVIDDAKVGTEITDSKITYFASNTISNSKHGSLLKSTNITVALLNGYLNNDSGFVCRDKDTVTLFSDNSFYKNNVGAVINNSECRSVTYCTFDGNNYGLKTQNASISDISNDDYFKNAEAGLCLENTVCDQITKNNVGTEQTATGKDTYSYSDYANGDGIFLKNCKTSKNNKVIISENTIGFNTKDGIHLESTDAHILKNYIGAYIKKVVTDAKDTVFYKFGNKGNGIWADSASDILVGGGKKKIDSSNFVCCNKGNGIVLGKGSIIGNFIGLLPNMQTAGNEKSGICDTLGVADTIMSNYIGNSGEYGIRGCKNALIQNNAIGGFMSFKFGNKKWGIKGEIYKEIRDNYVFNNAEGAINLSDASNRISMTRLSGNQKYAINYTVSSYSKPSIDTAFVVTDSSITVRGTAKPKDKIELFIGSQSELDAVMYVDSAYADGNGKWSITIKRGELWNRHVDTWFIATATNSGQTSELSGRVRYKFISETEVYVTNTNDDGTGSLRAAFDYVNASDGKETIKVLFDIPERFRSKRRLFEILIATPLPALNKNCIVNGLTQPNTKDTASQVIVLGGLIKGDSTGAHRDGVVLNAASDITIKGLKFGSFAGSAIVATYATQKDLSLHISRCGFTDCAGKTSVLLKNISSASLDSLRFTKSFGVEFNSVGSVSATNITASLMDSTAIIVRDGKAVTLKKITIDKNNAANGIDLYNTSGATISECSIGESQIGVKLKKSSATITNNKFGTNAANLFLLNEQCGVLVDSSTATIQNNTIGASGIAGVKVLNCKNDVTISNNLFGKYDTAHLANLKYGVYIDSSSNITVKNNTITYSNEYGVAVYQGNNNVLSGNKFITNDFKAIGLLLDPLTNSWANNSIARPSIYQVEKTTGGFTVYVKTTVENPTIELFAADSLGRDAVEFFPDAVFTSIGNNLWKTTIMTSSIKKPYFTTTVTKDNNTSELGNSCLIVTNLENGNIGSFREALTCANYKPDESIVIFDIRRIKGKKEITVESSILPSVFTPIQIIGNDVDTIYLLSSGAMEYGLQFKGKPSQPAAAKVLNLVVNGFNDGVQSSKLDSLVLSGVSIINSKANGIALSDEIGTVAIRNSVVKNSMDNGVTLDGVTAHMVFLEQNTIALSNNNGVLFHNVVTDSAIVTKNKLFGSKKNGLFVDKSTHITQISECEFYQNDSVGLLAVQSMIQNISSNFSGTDRNAKVAKANTVGIELRNCNSELEVSRNVLFGNRGDALKISKSSADKECVITGNAFGTDASRTIKLGNGGHAISGDVAANTKIVSNYFAYNGGDGVHGCNGARILSNSFGGEHKGKLYPNMGWGISGNYYALIADNKFFNNGEGAIHVENGETPIHRCIFPLQLKGKKAIDIPDSKEYEKPVFETYFTTRDDITLTGRAHIGDTIEIYYNDSVDQTSARLLNTVADSAGQFSAKIPSGINYNYYGKNRYVATTTSSKGRTSELSDVKVATFSVCDNPKYFRFPLHSERKIMQDKKKVKEYEETYDSLLRICYDDSLIINGLFQHLKYEWTFNGKKISDTTFLKIRPNDSTQQGTYNLHVVDLQGCPYDEPFAVDIITEKLIADFLMASEAGVSEKVVLVDIAYHTPDSVLWDFGKAKAEKLNGNYVLSFADTGKYVIKMTAYLGTCVEVVSKTVHVETQNHGEDGYVYATSILNATLYPNPTSSLSTLRLKCSQEADFSVLVVNNEGYVLSKIPNLKATQRESSHPISTESLLPGSYFLKVTIDENNYRVIPFVKQ